MKRIAVIGCSGSGKSTFSRRLASALGIPVHHLDAAYWKPGWVPTQDEEWKDIVARLAAGDAWIIDGNYSGTLDMRLERADTVFFFDMPRRLCLYRIAKRWIMYLGRVRPDMNEGCPEKLDYEFVKWVWSFNKRSRTNIIRKLNEISAEKQVVVFDRPSEVKKFFSKIETK